MSSGNDSHGPPKHRFERSLTSSRSIFSSEIADLLSEAQRNLDKKKRVDNFQWRLDSLNVVRKPLPANPSGTTTSKPTSFDDKHQVLLQNPTPSDSSSEGPSPEYSTNGIFARPQESFALSELATLSSPRLLSRKRSNPFSPAIAPAQPAPTVINTSTTMAFTGLMSPQDLDITDFSLESFHINNDNQSQHQSQSQTSSDSTKNRFSSINASNAPIATPVSLVESPGVQNATTRGTPVSGFSSMSNNNKNDIDIDMMGNLHQDSLTDNNFLDSFTNQISSSAFEFSLDPLAFEGLSDSLSTSQAESNDYFISGPNHHNSNTNNLRKPSTTSGDNFNAFLVDSPPSSNYPGRSESVISVPGGVTRNNSAVNLTSFNAFSPYSYNSSQSLSEMNMGSYFDTNNKNLNNNQNNNSSQRLPSSGFSSISVSPNISTGVAGPRQQLQNQQLQGLLMNSRKASMTKFQFGDDDESSNYNASNNSGASTPVLTSRSSMQFSNSFSNSFPAQNSFNAHKSSLPSSPSSELAMTTMTSEDFTIGRKQKVARTESQNSISSLLQQSIAKKRTQNDPNSSKQSSLPSSIMSPDGPLECTNCHTKTTPLWRRNPQGHPLCNACGLFQKLHGEVRPLSLKTDVIKKRNRASSSVKDSKLGSSFAGSTGASSLGPGSVESSGLSSPPSSSLTRYGSQPQFPDLSSAAAIPISAGRKLSQGLRPASEGNYSKPVPIAPKLPMPIAPAPPKSNNFIQSNQQPAQLQQLRPSKQPQSSRKKKDDQDSQWEWLKFGI